MFLIISAGLIVIAAVLAALGVSVTNPTTEEVVAARSLLNKDGLTWFMTSMVGNFSSFAALGVVLAMQMAIQLRNQALNMYNEFKSMNI